jgi:hypothetical protein
MLTIKRKNGKVEYEYENIVKEPLSASSDIIRTLPYMYLIDRHKDKKNWMLKNKKVILEMYDLFIQLIPKLNLPNFELNYYPHYLMKSIIEFLYQTKN